MEAFNDVQGLDIRQVKEEVSFPVTKETVHTEEDMRVNRDAVVSYQDGEKSILGLVPQKRQVIPYSEVVDWVTGVFDSVGVPFKLKESTLTGRSKNLFQSYLFNQEVDTPDSQDISPMFLLRSSYVGNPVQFDIGTYRFVCSNGAIVGNTLESIKIKAKDLDGLLTHDLLNDVKMSLDRMMSVSRRYQQLANEEMNSYLMEFFNAPFVSVGFKKAMVDYLEQKGVIEKRVNEVLKGNDFLSMRKSDQNLVLVKDEEAFKILEEKSAWDFYNLSTELSTHQSRNVHIRDWNNRAISEVFAA